MWENEYLLYTFDFLIQGTVNPTSYNIIYDKSGLKPDHLQMLTYKLCHLYFNWPGTVRVPSVCQYAHKLAFLVGNSIHKAPRRDGRKHYIFRIKISILFLSPGPSWRTCSTTCRKKERSGTIFTQGKKYFVKVHLLPVEKPRDFP